MLPPASPARKALALGTALWGWGVDRGEAHRLLDTFASSSGRVVDTATNYPIDSNPAHHGLACRWIAEWLRGNGGGVAVLAKFGAVDNLGGPETRLDPASVREDEARLRELFGPSLAAMAIHWDNRGDNPPDSDAIAATAAEMARLHASGLSIGFSGVRHPRLYLAAAPGLCDHWWIQVKENLLTDQARRHYSSAFPGASYLAYGINMGGVKVSEPVPGSSAALRRLSRPEAQVARMAAFLESDHGLRPEPRDLNGLALAAAYHNPALSGVILGPRNTRQLQESLAFWRELGECDSPGMAAIISDFARDLR